jgi:hypothetical protein
VQQPIENVLAERPRVQQHRNEEKARRRAAKDMIGARQLKKRHREARERYKTDGDYAAFVDAQVRPE